MTGEIYGVRKRSAVLEACPSCKLHGRTSWLLCEVSVFADAIEAQLACPAPNCLVLIRRPSRVPTETGNHRSKVRSSFRTLWGRVFTPKVAMAALTAVALFGYALLR